MTQEMTRYKFAQPICFHKKRSGEIQFHPSIPRCEPDPERPGKVKEREGAVYINIAKPLAGGDGDQMDWANKLIFKLSAFDISVIITMCRMGSFPVKLIHDNKSVKTNLTIEQGQPVAQGDLKGLMTYKWTLGRGGNYYSVYLNAAEMHALFNCFESVQPVLLGWGADLVRAVVDQSITDARRQAMRSAPQAARSDGPAPSGYRAAGG